MTKKILIFLINRAFKKSKTKVIDFSFERSKKKLRLNIKNINGSGVILLQGYRLSPVGAQSGLLSWDKLKYLGQDLALKRKLSKQSKFQLNSWHYVLAKKLL